MALHLRTTEFDSVICHESSHLLRNLSLHWIFHVPCIAQHGFHVYDNWTRKAFLDHLRLPLEVRQSLGFHNRGITSISYSSIFSLRCAFACAGCILVLFVR